MFNLAREILVSASKEVRVETLIPMALLLWCMEGDNLPRIEEPISNEIENDELHTFAECAFERIRVRLDENRETTRMTNVEKTLEEVLANHNTRTIDIRAKPLENPKVTLWLKDCPIWANDSWTETIYPNGMNAYNGKTTVTFDVRPF